MAYIAEGLKENRVLKTLELDYNHVGDVRQVINNCEIAGFAQRRIFMLNCRRHFRTDRKEPVPWPKYWKSMTFWRRYFTVSVHGAPLNACPD